MRALALALSFVLAGAAAEAQEGRAAYRAACAACHGADGRGASRDVVGFDLPLVDLTDCRFTNREPDLDWIAVMRMTAVRRAVSHR